MLASGHSRTNTLGRLEDLPLIYKGKPLQHTFHIMKLSLGTRISIGTDLMPKLGIALTGLALSWDEKSSLCDKSDIPVDVPQPNNSPAGTTAERERFTRSVQPSLDRNAQIPKASFCTVAESIIYLDTPEGVTSYRPQYPLPEVYKKKVARNY